MAGKQRRKERGSVIFMVIVCSCNGNAREKEMK
jgi:hypothetical protein